MKINIHCHFMHLSHLPNEYTSFIIRKEHPILNFDDKDVKNIVRNVISKMPGNLGKFARAILDENIYGLEGLVDNYIKKGEYLPKDDIDHPIQRYDILVPLMMDMISATHIENEIKNSDGVIPLYMQCQEFSYFAAKYPYKIFPFVIFNPLKEGSLELCQYAIENLGFIGIKMYPALGYTPLLCNDDDSVNDRSKKFYKWANNKKLPITIHTQYVSLQNIEYAKDEDKAAGFNEVDVNKWNDILTEYQNIRVNFAHMGGIEFAFNEEKIKQIIEKDKREKVNNRYDYSTRNQEKILQLMNKPNFFTDVAALNPKTDEDKRWIDDKKFIDKLNKNLDEHPDQIMFGTDTPASTIDNIDEEVDSFYEESINENHKENFFSKNAFSFLFGNPVDDKYNIPQSYKDFIINSISIYNNPEIPLPPVPAWVNNN